MDTSRFGRFDADATRRVGWTRIRGRVLLGPGEGSNEVSALAAPMFQVGPAEDGVRVLRIDDGKVNAIGPDFLTAFQDAWAKATAGGDAVVLVGNAKAFSAGLDLKRLPGLERDEMLAFGRGFMQLFHDVLAYERPVVAAIDGPALAGGAILGLCADFRLVGPNARIGVTEVPVGIPFPLPVATLVRSKLPATEHAPAILHGAIRLGNQCVATGWAHSAHTSQDLLTEATELARDLAQSYPVAYASGKRALHDEITRAFATFAKNDADRWVDLVMHEDTLTAIIQSFARLTQK